MRYSSYYLRRSTAENAFRVCHRRGWEPTLRRAYGLWNVCVAIEPLQPVVPVAPEPSVTRLRLPAST